MPNFRYYNQYNRNNFNPFYRYPPNYKPYYYPNYGTTSTPNSNLVNEKTSIPASQDKSRNITPKEENYWLDLFGIKLYFDDVLILSLIFFLYKEEVKDEGLFLALVLLLIS